MMRSKGLRHSITSQGETWLKRRFFNLEDGQSKGGSGRFTGSGGGGFAVGKVEEH